MNASTDNKYNATYRDGVITVREMSGNLLKSRQPDEWTIRVIREDAKPEDVEGKDVIGNVPLALACLANSVWAIEFDGKAPRGQEYTLGDMQAAGARLRQYSVTLYMDL